MNLRYSIPFAVLMAVSMSVQCQDGIPVINTSHLDHLYEEVLLETGDSVGIIHIYAEYPDYNWVGDDDEGIACVDDATRAAIFYLNHAERKGSNEDLRKAVMLMKFTLAMQSDNGYFYNFIWQDRTIHKTGITTINEPNWWSWRALWCLSVFLESELFLATHKQLAGTARTARTKLVNRMLQDQSPETTYYDHEGISVPEWLPGKTAADQAALIVLGLAPMLEEGSPEVLAYAKRMADGIVHLQVNSKGDWFDGAFLCWRNLWHGYGSSQAYALLNLSDATGEMQYQEAALREVEKFYPALWNMGWLSSFYVVEKNNNLEAKEVRNFDQIAYGIRPAIFACAHAYRNTGDEKYLTQARILSTWFTGSNPAKAMMYDEETGRGFDGISSEAFVNKNSGAESTVEALLALQALQNISNN